MSNANNAPVYDRATHTIDSSASGNPGANNPGAGQMQDGETGVKIGSALADLSHGIANPNSVGTGAASVMGAGGMEGTGIRDMTDTDEDAASDILANTATSGVSNSATTVIPTTGAGMGTGSAGMTGGNTLSGGTNAGTAS